MVLDTLSARGVATAKTSMRSILSPILSDGYDSRSNPNGYVNMGTAENYIMTKEVSEFANKNMTTIAKTFTYGDGPWGSGRLRSAMATHMTNHFHPVTPIDPDHILFANGITSLCELLGWVLAEPGEGILLPSPIYQAFATDFGAKANVKCVFTPFHGIDQFSPACVDKYGEALLKAESEGIKIRALLLCNPHNPLGQCYPIETQKALMQFCQRHKIHLLSDEVYALSVYDIPNEPQAVPFDSVLSYDSTPYIDQNLLHVLYGFSKDFASGGLRLGCIYTRNEALMDAIGAITQFAWSGSMNETIATLMLEDEAWLSSFFTKSRTALAERNMLVRSRLEERSIEYSRGSNAGFFIWINLRPWLPKRNADGKEFSDEWEREEELVKKMSGKKVYFTDGKCLSAEEAGWFRVIFSQEDDVIEEGFKRLWEVLHEVERNEDNERSVGHDLPLR